MANLEEFDPKKYSDLLARVEILESINQKTISHRMSYLTWFLVNPGSLIFIPTILCFLIEIWISNWGIAFSQWSLGNFNNPINWTIPFVVAIVGFIISFGNKLYLLIQERGDMNIEGVLDAKINGLNRRIQLERKEQQEEYRRQDAELAAERQKWYDDLALERQKRDAELAAERQKRDAELAVERQRQFEDSQKRFEESQKRLDFLQQQIMEIKIGQARLEERLEKKS